MPWLAAFLDGIAGKNGICTDFKHMMLGSKAFDPSDTELLCTACSRNSQKHSQFAHFSLKNGYLLMFLAGPKVKNSPASKLASNF
ncbi:hypothetical protein DW931_14365 [Clostridium sp. AM43-3BH]|uniref:hypothetical protein n=1 Tax=unclassified Clostridium TaxID=2614128 RepID=UPI000E481F50|nr:hypothetical protein [Clostridium sp. AM43-3BH]RHO89848.1 hypothetical protein DW023_10115 [Clostridium sp. AF37-7]RHS41364.1 hypothetical protein DWV17_08455 [Clostridium sp. AF02-29]RHS69318.1 hypothetical protein DW931_14365 [Clostridium sp. AM43-3BH]